MPPPEPGVGPPRIVEFGEAALLVVLGEGVDLALNRRVHALERRLRSRLAGDPRWERPVPAYGSLLIAFDPLAIEGAAARAVVAAIVAETGDEVLDREVRGAVASGGLIGGASSVGDAGVAGGGRLVEVAVRYGGADGPDLPEVAARLGLSEAAVVELHAGELYTVFMLGFVPGFPYLGVLPAALELPRRTSPRARVPAGSVAIAGRQTAIYPFETPGGWHCIGRTDATLWDPATDPTRPTLLEPGDRVRFVPG